MPSFTPQQRTWTVLLVGLSGALVALVPPFVPVVADSTTVTWPVPGQPVTSSGNLHEIPSRLLGHPEIDWGSVLVSDDLAARDAYHRSVSRAVVPGIGATRGQRPER